MSDDPALLHVYPQSRWHAPVVLVGNRAGLRALAAALARVETQGQGTALLTTADGEGYTLEIRADDSSWTGPSWTDRARPYTDVPAIDQRANAVWPLGTEPPRPIEDA